jgi:hypothetical protein
VRREALRTQLHALHDVEGNEHRKLFQLRKDLADVDAQMEREEAATGYVSHATLEKYSRLSSQVKDLEHVYEKLVQLIRDTQSELDSVRD